MFVQRNAVNDALSHLKTMTSRRIREKYDLRKEVLDKGYLKQSSIPATESRPIASLVVSGEQIPLYKYGGASPTKPTPLDWYAWVNIRGQRVRARPSQQATGHQFIDSPSDLQVKFGNKAFVAKMHSGHIGIFARDGGRSSEDSDAISELFGSSAATMITNEDVAEDLSKDAEEWYEKRLHHYVTQLLTGGLRIPSGKRGGRRR